ncbi:unnamed protein product [Penicillium nalgiovense]|nr:unnamed protein product [Penicillium nalgiovense]
MAAQPPSQKPKVQPCRYKTGKTLGAGSYSVVKECVHIDTGRYYAAKVINKRLMSGREHMVRNEIAVLKKVSLGHQNILTLVDYFETMNNLYLVTDLALGGELFDRICRKGSYYESDAADLMRAVLSAVAYLHDHGIVHRDLKPENLLFRTPEDNADLLIADFGLSRIMDEEQFHVLTTTCGTPGYMAPEIFKKSGHGKPVDIWAIGVITYFLLCGYTPFDRDSNLEEMQAILAADYSFTPLEYWRGVSQEARNFISSCLTVNPKSRMTAHEALQHPWVNLAYDSGKVGSGEDLLPNVKKNFNARRTLHRAIDTVRAINKLREGGGFMMDGVLSVDPKPERVNGDEIIEEKHNAPPLRRSMLAGLICRLIVVVMRGGRLRSRSGRRSGELRRWLLVCGAVPRVRMHRYLYLAFVYAVFRPLACSHSVLGESLAALLWDFSFCLVPFQCLCISHHY